jgi:hypothetical protein
MVRCGASHPQVLLESIISLVYWPKFPKAWDAFFSALKYEHDEGISVECLLYSVLPYLRIYSGAKYWKL